VPSYSEFSYLCHSLAKALTNPACICLSVCLLSAFSRILNKFNLLVSCYLRLMGYVAGQLRMPISCQCRSSLFLNVLIDCASTTMDVVKLNLDNRLQYHR